MFSADRRKSQRFFIRLALTVRWINENVVGEVLTETCDVSARGLCFRLPQELKSGSSVEILMTVPPELTRAAPVHVRCQGHVLRISASSETGTIVAVETFRFIRDTEGAA